MLIIESGKDFYQKKSYMGSHNRFSGVKNRDVDLFGTQHFCTLGHKIFRNLCPKEVHQSTLYMSDVNNDTTKPELACYAIF